MTHANRCANPHCHHRHTPGRHGRFGMVRYYGVFNQAYCSDRCRMEHDPLVTWAAMWLSVLFSGHWLHLFSRGNQQSRFARFSGSSD